MFFYMGSGTLSHSDDVAYLQSGIVFANTGLISVWSDRPTATIMPGMPVLTGIMYSIFGEGPAYIDSMRILWIILGSISPYVLYRISLFFLPAPYALLAAAGFLLPQWSWSDNAVLTESPYMLFFLLCLYFVFCMGEENGERNKKNIVGFVLSFMAALMIRANILLFLVFAAAYLVILKKKTLKQLLIPAAALALTMLIFVIPWSIRNYRIFDRFIPITAGTANPGLKGTYQGEGAPSDESLDYETNVYAPIREKYADYYNEDGTLKNENYMENINLDTDRLQKEYRLREWFKSDPFDLFWSYFVSKPACMINWVWFWLPLENVYKLCRLLSQVNMVLCIVSVVLSLIMKKKRAIALFLAITYSVNLYIIAMSFASERYAAMFLPYRYMLAAVAIYLMVQLFSKLRNKKALHA
ncbi:MAG: hypothetical protein IJB09_01750 [Oscillospiraceae bacterium]|nr:hypothetical protein [Oscillospiraceae bacterium]